MLTAFIPLVYHCFSMFNVYLWSVQLEWYSLHPQRGTRCALDRHAEFTDGPLGLRHLVSSASPSFQDAQDKVLAEEKPSQATHARHLSHGRIPASYLGNSCISQLAKAVRFTISLSPPICFVILLILHSVVNCSCCILSCLHCQGPHSFNISPKNSKKCDGEANHKHCLNATLSKPYSPNRWWKWTPVRPSSWAQSCSTSHYLLNWMLSRLELLAGCKQALTTNWQNTWHWEKKYQLTRRISFASGTSVCYDGFQQTILQPDGLA